MFTPAFQRIGHGGASALAPANTLASFDAALAVGVDMIEFDVREFRGELVLAHTLLDARRAGNLRFEAALAHLSGSGDDGVAINVDVKRTGHEAQILTALRSAGFLERTVVSSQVPLVLDRLRALEPRLRLGISVGGRVARTSRRWRDWRAGVLAGMASRRWDTLMAQYRLVDSNLIGAVEALQGQVYAWTVNQRAAIERLTGLGVHGITTADPRLFA